MLGKLSKMFEEIASKAQNVLEEFWLVFSASFDKPKIGRLLGELSKLYPALAKQVSEKYYRDRLDGNHARLKVGVEEGLILPQLDLNYFAVTFTNHIFGLPAAEKYVPSDARKAIIIYLRGMATDKGREFIIKPLPLLFFVK